MALRRTADRTVGIAVTAIVIGWVAAGLSATGFVSVARENLHFLCIFATDGDDDDVPGSWVCQDGISYIGVAVGTGLVLTAAAVVALLVLCTRVIPGHGLDRFRAAHGPERLLIALTIAPGACAVASTLYAASTVDISRVQDEYPDGLWMTVMGGPSVLLALGAAAALIAALIPDPAARVTGAAIVFAVMLLVPATNVGLAWISPLPIALLIAALALEQRPTVPSSLASSSSDAGIQVRG